MSDFCGWNPQTSPWNLPLHGKRKCTKAKNFQNTFCYISERGFECVPQVVLWTITVRGSSSSLVWSCSRGIYFSFSFSSVCYWSIVAEVGEGNVNIKRELTEKEIASFFIISLLVCCLINVSSSKTLSGKDDYGKVWKFEGERAKKKERRKEVVCFLS